MLRRLNAKRIRKRAPALQWRQIPLTHCPLFFNIGSATSSLCLQERAHALVPDHLAVIGQLAGMLSRAGDPQRAEMLHRRLTATDAWELQWDYSRLPYGSRRDRSGRIRVGESHRTARHPRTLGPASPIRPPVHL